MIYILLIAAGLILGSFINALIWRLHEQSQYFDDEGKPNKLSGNDRSRLNELSIAKGRSMCSKCGHQLSSLDLIPVFSWVALRGRCRYCKQKIEDNPLIEVALPILLILTYIFWPFSVQTPLDYILFGVWVLIMTCFVALAAYDAKWYLLPDKIVLPLTVLTIVFVLLRTFILGDVTQIYQAFVAGVVLSGIFLTMYIVSKGTWIGFGDVKLAISLGLIVGTPIMALLVLFVASLLGTLVALPQLLTSGRGMNRTIPFGPYLLIGTVLVFLFGEVLSELYLNLLLS